MTVGDRRLISLVKELVSEAPRVRENACGTVADWVNSLNPREATLLAMILFSSATIEEDLSRGESQLHALVELSDTGFVHTKDFSPLSSLSRSVLQDSEVEYVDYLTAEYAEPGTSRGTAPASQTAGVTCSNRKSRNFLTCLTHDEN
ncbi:hypothetical protein [Streptomyces sp. S465]|uniref:hypothetical protein n=1 Tax=Streptomyces sp. S465 TaxID=2979468 RepID=UPI0022A8BAF2|nr:hypothetical protein [Streptomyces sp. S465]WAP55281.1 hypothetical protein N6H00_09985 [Streptomyces sp. S465]